MSIILIQFIILIIIVGVLFLTFKFDKKEISVKDMSLLAFLCVATAVLTKIIVIKIPPGQPILVIGIALVLSIFIGILYSPKLSVLAGLIIDIIGVIIAPLTGEASMPFLGYTLSSMFACLIPSLMYRNLKKISDITFSIIMSLLLIGGLVFSFIYLNTNDEIKLDQNIIVLNNNIRIIFLTVLAIIVFFIIVLNLYLSKKHQASSIGISIPKLSFIIIVSQIVIHIFLGSLWVNTMYEIPMSILVIIRIIKGLISLPLYLLLLVIILRVIPANRIKK